MVIFGLGSQLGVGNFTWASALKLYKTFICISMSRSGGQEESAKDQQSYFILLYFTKVLNVKSLLGLQ